MRFCLDELTGNMDCMEILQFLTRIEELGDYDSNLQVLAKLKSYLNKCWQTPELVAYIVGFASRLYKSHPDLPTCEQIALTLESIVRIQVGTQGSCSN